MLKKAPTNLPETPGIYKMLDKKKEIIYIGKAKNIKKRVRQYFREGYSNSSRTAKLMEKVSEIETISVDSELEAIILETGLIQKHQPKYNIIMKDDKSFVYIKITNEDFPKIQIVREVLNDNAKYFGPKTEKHKVTSTLKLLKKIFPFRHCNLGIQLIDEQSENEKNRVKITNKVLKYPCLDYYIKRCNAPCIGKISRDEYNETIKKVENFLKGNADEIIQNLSQQMTAAALERKYEKAAKLRDKILKIQDILEKQKVASPGTESQDIINFCTIQNKSYFNLFQIRDGKLIGQENFTLSSEEIEESDSSEILSAFLTNYYQMATDIPKEVLVPYISEDFHNLQSFLEIQTGKKINFKTPKIGTKHKLLEMSLMNAQIYADRSKPSWKKESELTIAATQELQKIIGLKEFPKRIECYDISHLGGTNTVASMVVFKNGAPEKKHYRKFNVKTVEHGKPDDFKSMEEVVLRRLNYIKDNFKYNDLKVTKCTKKDIEDIGDILNHTENKNIYVLKKDEEKFAYCKIEEISEQTTVIDQFILSNKTQNIEFAKRAMMEFIKKCKGKRAYIFVEQNKIEQYIKFGFEEVKKIKKELQGSLKKDRLCLVYDKIKQKSDASFSEIPDLIIIDGGKGQLSSACKALKQVKIKIPLISLAKKQEEIFMPLKEKSIILPKNNKALQLIQRARDEAHRFAITFQKSKRQF